MKVYKENYQFLSGTSACRWYINENEIPAIRTFQRGYNFNLLSFIQPTIRKLHTYGKYIILC